MPEPEEKKADEEITSASKRLVGLVVDKFGTGALVALAAAALKLYVDVQVLNRQVEWLTNYSVGVGRSVHTLETDQPPPAH